jgi:GNAT superfamily N-acetyltransferase
MGGKPFTVEMVLTKERDFPDGEKSRLSQLLNDSLKVSFEYVVRTGMTDIQGMLREISENQKLTYTETRKISKDTEDIRISSQRIEAKVDTLLSKDSQNDPNNNALPPLRSNIFSSNVTVVGRDDMVNEIDEAFDSMNIIVLYGEGGIGKSVLADYYADKSRDLDSPNMAEIIAVHTLDSVWGKGVGHAMMEFALAELRRQGYHEVILWVFQVNDRARKFYERHGFTVDGAVKDSGFGNAQEVRYRRMI